VAPPRTATLGGSMSGDEEDIEERDSEDPGDEELGWRGSIQENENEGEGEGQASPYVMTIEDE
jgi:hypothetical protein